MTVSKVIGDALSPLGHGKVTRGAHTGPGTGSGAKYFTFNATALPFAHADDGPTCIRQLIQVHFFAPPGTDTVKVEDDVCIALFVAGCTWPMITPSDDETGVHIIFECEYLEGVPDNGEV